MEYSVEVISYGIGVCGNELGSTSRYVPSPGECSCFGTEASELNTAAEKNLTNFKIAGRPA